VSAFPAFDDFMPRRPRRLSSQWIFIGFVVVGPLCGAAVATGQFDSPIKCEQHFGQFAQHFSADFDIDRTECRVPWLKQRSPVVYVWGWRTPYIGAHWGHVNAWVAPPYIWIDHSKR
jgi:hypothetical protein